MNRRRVLRTAGAAGASAMTGVSGCLGLLGGDTSSGERAGYVPWTRDILVLAGEVDSFSLDLDAYRRVRSQSEGTQTGSGGDRGPVAAVVESTLDRATDHLGFGLHRVGLGSLDEDGTAQQAHLVGDGLVLEGSFDTTAVSSSVTEAGGEPVESFEGYTLYRCERPRETLGVGVSGDAVIVSGLQDHITDSLSRLEFLVYLEAGHDAGPSDPMDPYRRLASSLPSRDLMTMVYTDGGLFGDRDGGSGGARDDLRTLDLGGNALGSAVSTSLDTGQRPFSVAILYRSPSEVDSEADIRAAFGDRSDDLSVTIDEDMVYVERTDENPAGADDRAIPPV